MEKGMTLSVNTCKREFLKLALPLGPTKEKESVKE
jgi:hypothetical protein